MPLRLCYFDKGLQLALVHKLCVVFLFNPTRRLTGNLSMDMVRRGLAQVLGHDAGGSSARGMATHVVCGAHVGSRIRIVGQIRIFGQLPRSRIVFRIQIIQNTNSE